MKISALVSSHNKAPWIERCIRSIADQSHPPVEIVVCEDVSTDGTRELLRSLRIPGLRVLEYPEKAADWIERYMAHSALCRGEYVHMVGADDYLLPGFYEAAAASAAGCGLVMADTRVANAAGSVRTESKYNLPPGPHYKTAALRRWLCNPELPGGVPIITHKDVVKWFRETRMERCSTWMDSVGYAASMWPFGVSYLPRPFAVWTEEPDSFGGANRPEGRKRAALEGTLAWLDDPKVVGRVPPDVVAALRGVVK